MALHPFSSMTPAQVRSQHRQTTFTPTQQSLVSEVQNIVAQVPTRTPAHITLPELQAIMAYKLTFGQNRPALRAMIKRNSTAQVEEVSGRALAHLLDDGEWEEVRKAMDALCELKGVGPATASLILSLLYPITIPFFSDEATVDLLTPPGGRKGIKYTAKTYKALYEALDIISSRINQNAPQEDPIRRGELEREIWHAFRVNEPAQSDKGKRARDEEYVDEKPKRKRKKT